MRSSVSGGDGDFAEEGRREGGVNNHADNNAEAGKGFNRVLRVFRACSSAGGVDSSLLDGNMKYAFLITFWK